MRRSIEMTNNVQIIKDAYAAFGRGDIAAVLAATTDTTEWNLAEPAGGVFRGHEALTSFFQGLSTYYETLAATPETYVADGDTVVVLALHHEKAKATGTSLDVPFAHAFTMKDGRVAKMVEYADTAALVR